MKSLSPPESHEQESEIVALDRSEATIKNFLSEVLSELNESSETLSISFLAPIMGEKLADHLSKELGQKLDISQKTMKKHIDDTSAFYYIRDPQKIRTCSFKKFLITRLQSQLSQNFKKFTIDVQKERKELEVGISIVIREAAEQLPHFIGVVKHTQ